MIASSYYTCYDISSPYITKLTTKSYLRSKSIKMKQHTLRVFHILFTTQTIDGCSYRWDRPLRASTFSNLISYRPTHHFMFPLSLQNVDTLPKKTKQGNQQKQNEQSLGHSPLPNKKIWRVKREHTFQLILIQNNQER